MMDFMIENKKRRSAGDVAKDHFRWTSLHLFTVETRIKQVSSVLSHVFRGAEAAGCKRDCPFRSKQTKKPKKQRINVANSPKKWLHFHKILFCHVLVLLTSLTVAAVALQFKGKMFLNRLCLGYSKDLPFICLLHVFLFHIKVWLLLDASPL